MKRVLIAAVLLTVVGCSPASQVTEIPSDELPQSIYSTRRRTSDETVNRRVVIYFVRKVRESEFVLEPVVRTGPTSLSAAEFAWAHLRKAELETESEQQLELGTAIPKATELLGIEIADRVAEVNLSSAFEDPEDELAHLLRIAQVVWTLTELHDVDAVRFLIHGVPQPVITQDGDVQLQVGKGQYSTFAPAGTEALPVA